MMDEDLEKLIEACYSATPGPWTVTNTSPHKGTIKVEEGEGIETIADVYCGALTGHGAANAKFIALARNVLPHLAQELAFIRREYRDAPPDQLADDALYMANRALTVEVLQLRKLVTRIAEEQREACAREVLHVFQPEYIDVADAVRKTQLVGSKSGDDDE